MEIEKIQRCKCSLQGDLINKETTITRDVGGEDIAFEMELEYCGDCSGLIFTEYFEKQINAKAYECYYKKHSLLTPRQIKGIREDLGLSCRKFGVLLGVSYHHMHGREHSKKLYDKEFVDKVKNVVRNW